MEDLLLQGRLLRHTLEDSIIHLRQYKPTKNKEQKTFLKNNNIENACVFILKNSTRTLLNRVGTERMQVGFASIRHCKIISLDGTIARAEPNSNKIIKK
jgi:hypothetical protein